MAVLLDAAEDVLATNGAEATTMAAIAKRAKVAVGTLYNYFPDRDALFSTLFHQRRSELVPGVIAAARAAQRLPFERRLRAYITAVMNLFEQRRKFLAVVNAVDQKAIRIRTSKQPTMSAVTEAFTDILLAVSPEHAEEKARMIVAAMKTLVLWRLERGEPLAMDADLIADTFLAGVSA